MDTFWMINNIGWYLYHLKQNIFKLNNMGKIFNHLYYSNEYNEKSLRRDGEEVYLQLLHNIAINAEEHNIIDVLTEIFENNNSNFLKFEKRWSKSISHFLNNDWDVFNGCIGVTFYDGLRLDDLVISTLTKDEIKNNPSFNKKPLTSQIQRNGLLNFYELMYDVIKVSVGLMFIKYKDVRDYEIKLMILKHIERYFIIHHRISNNPCDCLGNSYIFSAQYINRLYETIINEDYEIIIGNIDKWKKNINKEIIKKQQSTRKLAPFNTNTTREEIMTVLANHIDELTDVKALYAVVQKHYQFTSFDYARKFCGRFCIKASTFRNVMSELVSYRKGMNCNSNNDCVDDTSAKIIANMEAIIENYKKMNDLNKTWETIFNKCTGTLSELLDGYIAQNKLLHLKILSMENSISTENGAQSRVYQNDNLTKSDLIVLVKINISKIVDIECIYKLVAELKHFDNIDCAKKVCDNFGIKETTFNNFMKEVDSFKLDEYERCITYNKKVLYDFKNTLLDDIVSEINKYQKRIDVLRNDYKNIIQQVK